MTSPEMLSRQLKATIRNKRGLHARASAKLCAVAGSFEADISVIRDEIKVCATSIMGLMMLGAAKGCEITFEASGPQAIEALDTLGQLVNDLFGEED